MKYLLVFGVMLFGFWLWSSNRRADKADSAKPNPKQSNTDEAVKQQEPASVQRMLQCAVCGVHVPQTEALVGLRGTYCGETHRKQAEG